jgi:hypothetical protein
MTLCSGTRQSREGASQAPSVRRGLVPALVAGATSIARALRVVLEPYLPWSRARVRGWETALGMWGALGEAPRARTRPRGSCNDV